MYKVAHLKTLKCMWPGALSCCNRVTTWNQINRKVSVKCKPSLLWLPQGKDHPWATWAKMHSGKKGSCAGSRVSMTPRVETKATKAESHICRASDTTSPTDVLSVPTARCIQGQSRTRDFIQTPYRYCVAVWVQSGFSALFRLFRPGWDHQCQPGRSKTQRRNSSSSSVLLTRSCRCGGRCVKMLRHAL